jgi:hypothetical protein
VQAPPGASGSVQEPPAAGATSAAGAEPSPAREASRGWWTTFAVFAALFATFYALLTFARLEVFKMLLTSFFPLMVLILAVLGSIVMGLATPTEAAAVGALGGFVLAFAYRQLTFEVVKESVFPHAKTSAMVCWLFVGSAIFSARSRCWAAGTGGAVGAVHEPQHDAVPGPVAGDHLHPGMAARVDRDHRDLHADLRAAAGQLRRRSPVLRLLVALNLQTAFLSPPVAMSAST